MNRLSSELKYKMKNKRYRISFNGTDLFSTLFLRENIIDIFVSIGLLLLLLENLEIVQAFIFRYSSNYFYGIENQLYGSNMLNIWFTVALIYCGINVCHKLRCNQHVSIFRLMCYLMGFALLSHQDKFYFVNSAISLVSYSFLCEIFLLLFFVIDVSKCYVPYTANISFQKGFVNTDTPVDSLNPIREAYARSLVKQILNVDTTKEAFSVSICGKWGSGKTTFLHDLRNAIGEDAYYVEFNPWNCQTPNQIISDFFEELNESLSPIYSPIEKHLINYMRELLGESNAINGFILKKIFRIDGSLEKLKSDISNELLHLRKKVFVVIDDIDRLDKDEVFEVLRLVRNTAKFCNIIFVVSMDDKYVVGQLEKKGILDGKLYLEKIFPLVVKLPKIDSFELLDSFKHDLRIMGYPVKDINSMFAKLNRQEYQVLENAIITFRKGKMFARQLAASMVFLNNSLGIHQYVLKDLMFIELLKFIDDEKYQQLANSPTSILSTEPLKSNGQQIYRYKENCKSLSDKILSILFGSINEYWIKRGSIQACDSFLNYFCYGNIAEQVSHLEFSVMLKSSQNEFALDGIKKIMSSWCKSNKCKKNSNSIYDKFVGYDIFSCQDNNVVRAYFYALEYWVEFDESCPELHLKTLHYLLDEKAHYAVDGDYVKKLAYNRFKVWVSRGGELAVRIAKILSRLYIPEYGSHLIIHNEEIKMFMIKNVEFLLSHKDWDALNVVQEDGNLLNAVLRNSLVNHGSVTRSNVSSTVIEYFSEKERKSNNYQRLKALLLDTLNDKTLISDSLKMQTVHRIIYNVFGTISQGMMDFETYCDKCFVR